MKTRYFVPILSAVFSSFPTPVSAQSRLSLEIFGGRTYLSENRRTLPSWEDGWTVGLGIAYPILPGFTLIANQSFSNFLFTQPPQPSYLLMAQPRVSKTSTLNLDGPFRIHGDNSQMYRTSLGTQFTTTKTPVRVSLSLETGVSVVDLGFIAYERVYRSGEPVFMANPSPYKHEGPTYTTGFGSIGFGIFAPLNSSVGLKLEGKWLDTWNNGDSYFPLTTTVSFQL